MSTINSRILAVLPVFSVISVLGYFVFMGLGISTFVYYPQVGVWTLTKHAGFGPPMLWYGWLSYSALSGGIAALFGAFWPAIGRSLTGQLSWVLWATPLAVGTAILLLLLGYL